jgi:N-acetylglutamate synthase-like GNAT family acetyltransferase
VNTNFPSSELVIRPASFNDIRYIQQIAATTWQSAYTPILGKEQIDYMLGKFYSTPSLEDQMKNKHHFFLALQDYLAVGFASFSHAGEKIYKLEKLYVLPDVQKTGAGKKLLETVETVAKSMGAEKLILNVNRKNKAKTFYEKNGFTVISEEDIDIGNGYSMNDYVMSLTLVPSPGTGEGGQVS